MHAGINSNIENAKQMKLFSNSGGSIFQPFISRPSELIIH